MRTIASLAMVALLPLEGVFAQEPPVLEPGQRIRVRVTDDHVKRMDGIVAAIGPDTLVLHVERFRVDARGRRTTDSVRTAVPLAEVVSIARHVGRRSRPGRGALIGGLSACLLGLGSSAAYYSSDEDGYAGYVFGGAVVVGAIGAGVGWIIGSAVTTDQWEDIPLDRVRAGIAP
jgi:hypothetical protein